MLGIFSSLLRDAFDIHWFPTMRMVETHFLLENLWILEPSLGIVEKFQHVKSSQNFLISSKKAQKYVLFIHRV